MTKIACISNKLQLQGHSENFHSQERTISLSYQQTITKTNTYDSNL